MAGRRWLDPKEQEKRNAMILRMKDEQGLEYEQIAPQFGLSVRSCKYIVHQAKREAQNVS